VILTYDVYACFSGRPVKDDGRMDVLKCSNSVPPEETAEDAAAAGALVEKDGFSVEDLLDLEEFGEPDKDGAEHEQDAPPVAAAVQEKSKADSQPLSVVTYEHPPPPPPPPEMVDLPVSFLGGPLTVSIRGKTSFASLFPRVMLRK